jgi:hypothetical protein
MRASNKLCTCIRISVGTYVVKNLVHVIVWTFFWKHPYRNYIYAVGCVSVWKGLEQWQKRTVITRNHLFGVKNPFLKMLTMSGKSIVFVHNVWPHDWDGTNQKKLFKCLLVKSTYIAKGVNCNQNKMTCWNRRSLVLKASMCGVTGRVTRL